MALSASDLPAIYSLLANSMNQDETIRKPAEAALSQSENRPGFCSCLMEVITAKDLASQVDIRLMASVYFKNSINRYWRNRRDSSGISSEEKLHLRQKLLSHLREENYKIAQMLAVLISKIARFDYPREWPELFSFLAQQLQSADVLTSHRIFMILFRTLKELSTKRLTADQRNFAELTDEACFILSKDFKNPLAFHEKDLDLAMLNKAIEELSVHYQVNNIALQNLKRSWSKEAEIIKEPHFCTALRNLLLYFPACVSADESGERLFLSDSNHHWIIIFDGNGKILDCIGSCPGFEDGEFESAKLLRPAASFYHATEDCLYIVDSENHAIRRADLERRVLETVYPASSINKKNTTLWTWIRTKLGFVSDADVKCEEHVSQTLMCPWHLIKSGDNSFLIISRSFETLWVMDFALGEIKEVVKGFPNTLELCRHLIMEKVSLLKKMPDYLLQQQTDTDLSLEGLPYAGLISCVTTFQNHIIMCDTVGQGVLKLRRESGTASSFQFSNLRMLGLPYWLSFPLERFYADAAGLSVGQTDHIQQFSLLPGRVDIRLSIDIPADTELVEPLHESCIWCQARGAATEVSVVEGVAGSSEKVGVAQQWYDELDNLAFSTPESELVIEDDNATTDTNTEDERIHIDCVVNTSPGTSEVIIYAALYVKLRRNHVSQDDSQEKLAARIADILNPERIEGFGGNSCIKFLLKSNRDLRDLIFIKPLHVRIKFNCQNHPKADNSKDIILTDSSLNIDVSL